MYTLTTTCDKCGNKSTSASYTLDELQAHVLNEDYSVQIYHGKSLCLDCKKSYEELGARLAHESTKAYEEFFNEDNPA
jgi:thymidine kinase